jgi:predicted 3-demethylubiquinone-9 3-methyltransferase (glyoxalase superfamily)
METQNKTEPVKTIKENEIQKITPFLWFDTQAEKAVNFYLSIFKNSKVITTTRYGDEGAAASGMPGGTIMTVAFQIEGQTFTAINGGPVFKISPSISFMVNCRTREETDELWKKLTAGGKILMEIDRYPFSERYGWVEDKFGVSWQLILATDAQKITPCLMFAGEKQGKAEEAINYYTSLFNHSGIERIERYSASEEGPTEAVKFASFKLNGQKFIAMDSGREVPFRFSQAISFVVHCETQKEVDYYWEKLSEGGDETAQICGWLKDRYDVSWQIVPVALAELLSDPDPEKSGRVMQAMLKMKKIEIAGLMQAYGQL